MTKLDEVIEITAELKGHFNAKGKKFYATALALAELYEYMNYVLKYIRFLEKKIEVLEKEKG